MHQILITPLHSIADIITNSSTELFICNTEKTEDQLRDFFEETAQVLGKWHGVGDIKVYQGVDGLQEAILSIGIDYLGYHDCLWDILSKFIPSAVLNLTQIPHIIDPFSQRTYARRPARETDEEWGIRIRAEIAEREHQAEVEKDKITGYFAQYREVLTPHINLVTVFKSADDNSIPYDLYEVFDLALNATHYHLG